MAKQQKEKEFFYITSVSKEERCTIDDFLNVWQKNVPSNKKKIDSKTFLSIKSDEDDKQTNLDKIWGTYTALEKAEYKNDYQNKSLPYIRRGTTVVFPKANSPLLLQKPSNEGQFMEQGDFSAYWSENYKKIIKDKYFVPDNTITLDKEGTGVSAKSIPLNIRIWIYSKALDKVIDVSHSVVSCVTSKTKENGIFSLLLSPFYYNGSLIKFGDSSVEYFNTVSNYKSQVKDFLEKRIQQNDLVFIRFERLQLEKDKSSHNSNDLTIPLSQLANSDSNVTVWDMIGIIDVCSSSYNASSNTKSFTIDGRDFSKLFTDDGSYFMPLKEIQGTADHWFYEGSTADAWFKRNIIDGSYNFLWSYGFKRIRELIWFIINVMSNIGLVQNKVFDSWKDKRTQSYDVNEMAKLDVNGIWQIVKVFVDDNINNRIVVDSSISNPNGTLMDYLNRFCQAPFVEFYFDTYVDTLDLVVRQPPFTEKAIMDTFSSGSYITVTPDNVINTNLSYDDRIYSWYQLHVQNNSLGNEITTSLAYVPIIYLNAYAEIFGNKKLEVTSIYLSYESSDGVNETEHLLNFQAAALNDLLFLVETNAYLPFTRRGTLTLNGDRRIKVGTFINFEFTNEFFYVTGVTNIISFDKGGLQRQTVLQVERGMYIPILKGDTIGTKQRQDNTKSDDSIKITPSYFKIVDTFKLKQSIEEVKKGILVALQSNPTVDRAQFDYFLYRKMYGGD